jgi:putative restriction endonuclease
VAQGTDPFHHENVGVKLFGRGYVTITPSLHIEVNRRIQDEFNDGEHYNGYHGKVIHPPERSIDLPSIEHLRWHNELIYKDENYS